MEIHILSINAACIAPGVDTVTIRYHRAQAEACDDFTLLVYDCNGVLVYQQDFNAVPPLVQWNGSNNQAPNIRCYGTARPQQAPQSGVVRFFGSIKEAVSTLIDPLPVGPAPTREVAVRYHSLALSLGDWLPAEEVTPLDQYVNPFAPNFNGINLGDARTVRWVWYQLSKQGYHPGPDTSNLQANTPLSKAIRRFRQAVPELRTRLYQRNANDGEYEIDANANAAAQQIDANEQAGQQLELELGAFDDTAAQSGLHAALAVRLEREQQLAASRSEYDDLGAKLRRADEQRLTLERSLEPQREQITRLQLELQAAQLGGAQYLEQLQAAAVDLDALGRSIEDGGVKLWGLQSEIDRIQREIAALGAVNLAALDELTASRERKTFLDAQYADLQEAIGTLEGAIHKIDLETRDLLASTFNQVNEHFGRMFPSLFGGGTAKLVMTGDEILDAGVQVMAQPPGKKNSTIHLLSGGEKALTAIALVFAIFQLNPAPFCLLDEVDAPLDDANTERYAKLVKEMAAGTQFLFISHNKIAMEMAEQLIGVTMQEQGVSRIVAVDMQAATSLAEAA
jgi:hypothetical protein